VEPPRPLLASVARDQDVRSLTTSLRRLLEEPQVAQKTVQALRSRKLGASAGATFEFKPSKYIGANAAANANVASEHKSESEAKFEESKMDGLSAAAVLIRSVLAEAHKHLGDHPTLIVLDDFYHIRFDDQPDVLAYLPPGRQEPRYLPQDLRRPSSHPTLR